MADLVICERQYLVDIADAIRSKTGSTAQMTINDIVENISNMGGSGDSYYDVFWDNFQDGGNRSIYSYLFVGEGWTNNNFKPKYDIRPSRINYMFQYSNITDLTSIKRPDGTSVALDFSGVSGNYVTRPFANSKIQKVGTINIAHVTASLNTFFADATDLHTIETLVLSEKNVFGTNAFQNCSSLANITIDGVISSAMNLSACPLTSDSVQSIINHLKDLTGAAAKELTFSAAVGASLTNEQKEAISKKNWTAGY